MAVPLLPLATEIALFSSDILQLWTRNSEVARNAGPIATLLVIGYAINGLMNLPYALQLAYGWTSIGLQITIGLSVIVVPALWFAAAHYGPVGAACVFVGFQAVQHADWLTAYASALVAPRVDEMALAGRRSSIGSLRPGRRTGKSSDSSRLSPLALLSTLFAVLLAAMAAAVFVAPLIRRRSAIEGVEHVAGLCLTNCALPESRRQYIFISSCESFFVPYPRECKVCVEVLKSKAEIGEAPAAQLMAGSCPLPVPRWKRLASRIGLSKGIDVGDELKSWDVLKTIEFIEKNVAKTDPVLDMGAFACEILCILHNSAMAISPEST